MSDDITPGDGYNTDTVRLKIGEIEKKQVEQDTFQKVNHERLKKVEETGEGIKIQLSQMEIDQAVRDERDETRHTATTKALGAQTIAIEGVALTIATEKTKSENEELEGLKAELKTHADEQTEKAKDWRMLTFKIGAAIIILLITTNLKDILIFFANALK